VLNSSGIGSSGSDRRINCNDLTEEILEQLPGDVLGGLRRADRLLASLRQDTAPVPMVVKHSQLALGTVDWDVVVTGGTLGILITVPWLN